MKCFFCKKECNLLYEDTSVEEWSCLNHNMSIIQYVVKTYHKKSDCKGSNCFPIKNHYVTTVDWIFDGNKYIVTFGHGVIKPVEFRITLVESFTYYEIETDVLTLPFLPDIIPEQFDDKLPNWILFS